MRHLLIKSVEIPVTMVLLGCVITLVGLMVLDEAVTDVRKANPWERVFG